MNMQYALCLDRHTFYQAACARKKRGKKEKRNKERNENYSLFKCLAYLFAQAIINMPAIIKCVKYNMKIQAT